MQTKINWESGNQHSHEPVEKFCVDCGRLFYAPMNAQRSMTRCPSCSELYKRERDIQRHRNKDGRRDRWDSTWKGNYKVIIDPSESWSTETHLRREEINSLIKAHYLDTGTVFQRTTDNKRFWVYMSTLREITT